MQRRIHVIATTYDGTLAALGAAIPLAKGSDAALTVLVPRIVSCAAELEPPPAPTELAVARYRAAARRMGAGDDVGFRISAYVGLDSFVGEVCRLDSTIVIGGPVGRWITSPEERFANRLALAGCRVVFVASGANATQRRIAA